MIAFPWCLSFPSPAAGERGKGREGEKRDPGNAVEGGKD